jgi:hypothetical protein
MTISQHHKEILQAILDGKQLQKRFSDEQSPWVDIDTKEAFGHIANSLAVYGSSFELRIKPEPKRLYGQISSSNISFVATNKKDTQDTHYVDVIDGDIVGYGRL